MEGVVHLSASQKPNRLPKRFPVGTTYVVEGSGGQNGDLRVVSRYVVLPGGRRINLTADFTGPASPRAPRGRLRARSESLTQTGGNRRSGRVKKISGKAGTTRQHRR
jgi:hypothetical protein